jgi:hypothetical protein
MTVTLTAPAISQIPACLERSRMLPVWGQAIQVDQRRPQRESRTRGSTRCAEYRSKMPMPWRAHKREYSLARMGVAAFLCRSSAVLAQTAPSPPTNTPTVTPTNSPTDTPTNTPTNTPTVTPTGEASTGCDSWAGSGRRTSQNSSLYDLLAGALEGSRSHAWGARQGVRTAPGVVFDRNPFRRALSSKAAVCVLSANPLRSSFGTDPRKRRALTA